ncbi:MULTISPECIES: dUTP diphosphatase [Bacillus]|uniref:dUTP diphosphatase n=1 Tax=Bacillus pretiosus TaxID=2983392 RepID=A0ABT3ETK7_9BACI|nr:dUTP diphosphatase [Bacillus pretiosus]MCW1240154.1 dUTP diphosphatase [Bacillus pretiosus]
MDMKKMIETIEAIKMTDEELSISTLHQKLVKLYSQKDSAEYTEILKYILSLSVQLNLHFVLKYFGVRSVVAADERMQFQEIFKCLAKKDDNGEWFLNFVSLYVGLIVVLHFDEKEIERSFFDDMVVDEGNAI